MKRLLGALAMSGLCMMFCLGSASADPGSGIYYDNQDQTWRNVPTVAAAPSQALPSATPIIMNYAPPGRPVQQQVAAPQQITRGNVATPQEESASNVVFRPAVYSLTPAPGDYVHNVYTQMFGDPHPFYGTPDPFPTWNGGGYDVENAYLQGISNGYGYPPFFGGGFPVAPFVPNTFNNPTVVSPLNPQVQGGGVVPFNGNPNGGFHPVPGRRSSPQP